MIDIEISKMDSSIKIREEIAGKITESILNTKEKKIKQALISLGWTPPKRKPLSYIVFELNLETDSWEQLTVSLPLSKADWYMEQEKAMNPNRLFKLMMEVI